MSESNYYPPAGIYFSVVFTEPENSKKNSTGGSIDADFGRMDETIGFQSVSGLTAEITTESYREGGQNEYEYKLPVRTQYPDLVLKRGLWIPRSPTNMDIQSWFKEAIRSFVIQPKTITIKLMNPALKEPVMSWEVYKAWPKKWSVSEFNAEENQIVIESMEFHYAYFEVK
ncbi:MAG: phage tail protein [Lewinellaceae bacterium]|nr:phage tail protein [Lewinellaceae bacterium]